MKIAPAARAALQQATLIAPKRSTASDGTVGDRAHRSRRSFHNPSQGDGVWDDSGTVLAFDLTNDPANGCDAHRLVRDAVARGDQRISEAISNGRIWTRARRAEGWRKYTGANPHDRHAHVSISWEHRNDTSPWWVPPATPDEEDDMTPEQAKQLKEVHQMLTALVRPRRSDKADHDPQAIDLGDILTKVESTK